MTNTVNEADITDDDLNLQDQKKIASNVNNFLLNNPTVGLGFLSAIIYLSGFISLLVIFNEEKINLFDYISIGDFFFGFFAIPIVSAIMILTLILIFAGYILSYSTHRQSSPILFWILTPIALIITPYSFTLFEYKPVSTYTPLTFYKVTYKVPQLPSESSLVLISSLSNYKIFKTACNNGTSFEFTRLVAIHDSSIANIKIENSDKYQTCNPTIVKG